jgi:hypothetical protein
MKKIFFIMVSFLFFSVVSVSAYTIDYSYSLDGPNDFTSPVTGATVPASITCT